MFYNVIFARALKFVRPKHYRSPRKRWSNMTLKFSKHPLFTSIYLGLILEFELNLKSVMRMCWEVDTYLHNDNVGGSELFWDPVASRLPW